MKDEGEADLHAQAPGASRLLSLILSRGIGCNVS